MKQNTKIDFVNNRMDAKKIVFCHFGSMDCMKDEYCNGHVSIYGGLKQKICLKNKDIVRQIGE